MIVATSFLKNEVSRNEFSSNDRGSERPSSVSAIATLLVVYTALYLAVVGAIHFASSPEAAAAVAPDVSSVSITATTLPAEPFAGYAPVPAAQLLEPDAAETDNSRECTDGIETACIYN
jgi:hypothetical protein